MSLDDKMAGIMLSRFLDCKDLTQLALTLKGGAEHWGLCDDNKRYEKIHQSLLDCIQKDDRPYSVKQGNDWVPTYLLHMWSLQRSVEENTLYWYEMADEIKQEYVKVKEPGITEQQVHAVMEHVEKRYGFCSNVLRDKPIDILLLPNKHIGRNSQYGSLINLSKPKSDVIVMLSMVDEGNHPEAVLLHELGHALHTRLTGKHQRTPKSFECVQKKMYVALEGCPAAEWCEYFADSFAIAALRDSPFLPNKYMEMYLLGRG